MGLHAIIYSLAFLVPAAIGFITFTTLTHFLVPYEYGVYSTGVNTAFFAGSVFFAWIRFSAGRYEAEGRGGLALRFWMLCFAAMVPLAAAVLFAIFLAGFVSSEVVLSIFFLSCCQSLFEISQEFRRARRQSQQFAIYNIVRSILSIALAIFIAFYFSKGLYLISGLAISFLCAAILNLVQQSRSTQFSNSRRYNIRTVVVYGSGLAVSGLVFSSMGVISRLMVAHFVGLSSAGPYNASLDLASQVGGIVAMSIFSVIAPVIIRAHADADIEGAKREFRRGGELLMAVIIPSTVGLMLVARPVVTLLTGEAFHETVSQLLPLTVVGVAIWNFNHYYLHIAFQITSRPFLQVLAGIIQLTLVVVFSFVLINLYGVIGAALALIAANAITAVVTFVLARRVFPIPIPVVAIFKISAGTLLMAASVMLVDRLVTPMFAKLIISVVVGGVVYVSFAIATNISDWRTAAMSVVRNIRLRVRKKS